MKKIKNLIKAEVQNDDDKILQKNKERRADYHSNRATASVAVKTFPNKFVFLTAPLVVLLMAVSVVLGIVLGTSSYSGIHETKLSNLTEVNNCLKQTQIKDGFDNVVATFDTKAGIKLFYTMSEEQITDDNFIQCTTDVIVDKKYNPPINHISFTKDEDFLKYIIKISEQVKQREIENIKVYDHQIIAYLDTGAERYYLRYTEITVSQAHTFSNYIQNLIFIKR